MGTFTELVKVILWVQWTIFSLPAPKSWQAPKRRLQDRDTFQPYVYKYRKDNRLYNGRRKSALAVVSNIPTWVSTSYSLPFGNGLHLMVKPKSMPHIKKLPDGISNQFDQLVLTAKRLPWLSNISWGYGFSFRSLQRSITSWSEQGVWSLYYVNDQIILIKLGIFE